MEIEHIVARNPFEGCQATFEQAEIVLVGAGFDGTSTYRPGSRFAPVALRAETIYSQENYSPYFQKDLTEKPIHDLGDIELPFGNRKVALQRIYSTIRTLLKTHKKTCLIGGEHLITLPAVQAVKENYSELRVVQVDAHLDLMDELFGEKISHGTVMRRIHELMDKRGTIYQVGIRSGDKSEYEFAQQNTRLFPFHTRDFTKKIKELMGFPIYLTLDLDVFDPSLIPGTGTPEAGGIFFPEYIEFLETIRELHIVACDVVELAPHLDPTGVSTMVAAKALRELLIVM